MKKRINLEALYCLVLTLVCWGWCWAEGIRVEVPADKFMEGNVLAGEQDGIKYITSSEARPSRVVYKLSVPQAGVYEISIRYASAAQRMAQATFSDGEMPIRCCVNSTGGDDMAHLVWEKLAVKYLEPGQDLLLTIQKRGGLPQIAGLSLVLKEEYKAYTRNLLKNGGFELGVSGAGWGCYNFQVDIRSMFQDKRFTEDTQIVREGKRSCRLDLDALLVEPVRLSSVGVPLAVDGKYYLSMWLKASRPKSVTLSISKVEFSGQRNEPEVARAGYQIGPEWARYSLPVDLQPDMYRVHLEVAPNFYDYEPSYVWIDAVQLEVGKMREYQPRCDIEYGLVNVKENGVHRWKGKRTQVPVKLRVSNHTGAELDGRFKWWVTDLFGKIVAEDIVSCKAADGDTVERIIDTQPGKKGALKMFVQRVDAQAKPLGEPARVVFGLVPDSSGRKDSFFGYHIHHFQPYYVNLAHELGGRWYRSLDSMPSIGRWEDEEPAAGQYVYSPADKVDYLKDRLHILGTLAIKPSWVIGRGGNYSNMLFPVDMELWREYVARTVANYKYLVKYWEIWNEPDCHFDPDGYAELIKIACEEIKKADPHAIVVGAGGVTLCPNPDSNEPRAKYGVDIVTKGALKYMDIFSVHLYTILPEDRDKEQAIGAGFLRKQGFTGEIWNTECMINPTASWYEDEPQCQLHLKASTTEGPNLLPTAAVTAAQRQIRHSLIQLGHGITKYFIYWLHASSSLSPGTGIYSLEYDRIPHPLLFAGAILEDKVAGSKCTGSVMLCGNTVKAVIFSKGKGAWAGLWVYKEGDKATLRLPEKGKWRITDIMDNDIAGGAGKEGILTVELTSSPIYIENRHMDAQALEKMFMEYNK